MTFKQAYSRKTPLPSIAEDSLTPDCASRRPASQYTCLSCFWVLIVLLNWSLLSRIQVASDWCLAASWSCVSLMSLEVQCVLRTWFGITVFLHRGLPVCRSLPFCQADPRGLQAEFGDSTPSFGVSSRLASVSSTVQGYNKNLRSVRMIGPPHPSSSALCIA